MTEAERIRIQKDAIEAYPDKTINGFAFPEYNLRERFSYIRGAAAEHERLQQQLKTRKLKRNIG